MVLALLDAGHAVVGLDSCINSQSPHAFFEPLGAPFYQGDIGDITLVEDIFAAHPDIDGIIHFAGLIYVGESLEKPHLYYQANTLSAFHFFHYALRRGIRNIVFSSSAGVYGEAKSLPIAEDHPREPINPYGRSKLMTEWMLEDMARLFPEARIVLLRYFNVAGADVKERTGQNSPRAYHLIEVACEAALGLREGMAIFGTDYDTQDGTCVRDYVHVNDLVEAHLCALRYNQSRNDGGAVALNCGYGHGYSNRQIIETVKHISGVDFKVTMAPRREGDPAALVAANDKILKTLDWQPQHADIEKIVSTAFEWKKRVCG
ncbi:MAG: UDP-glucose 4-epimerase GalE [Rhodospirillales bacterium]|nr:UDP-glucose 4-epimerase GalE [Rhodospirillales bacterium]MCB9980226.1 UDP-glucose 4-epimerase GalE [Rhodospirillales bacterium]